MRSSFITLTDAESTTIASATVTISSGYVGGEDVLGFTNQNGISGTVVGNSLTLSGTATVAAYQSALASVTYTDTAHDASTASRTVSFVFNDGIMFSNTAVKAILPQAVTIVPIATLTGLNGPAAFWDSTRAAICSCPTPATAAVPRSACLRRAQQRPAEPLPA